MDNNILFLVAFIFVIYFLFLRESENLEPELPASDVNASAMPVVAQPSAMPVVMQSSAMPSVQPSAMPVVMQPSAMSSAQPVQDKMTPQEKERVLCSLLPFVASGDVTYPRYLEHLSKTENKSKKLATQESFDKFNAIMANVNVNNLISLMDDA